MVEQETLQECVPFGISLSLRDGVLDKECEGQEGNFSGVMVLIFCRFYITQILQLRNFDISRSYNLTKMHSKFSLNLKHIISYPHNVLTQTRVGIGWLRAFLGNLIILSYCTVRFPREKKKKCEYSLIFKSTSPKFTGDNYTDSTIT